MPTLLHSESRRLYSWWWDSHISPRNSKWLQDNLTDMDAKVKAMIKLIEEDADSFARRAEMYYKKRPELMKLVEEFYRAYRALAERYDHATGELRQAHKTMAQAFPDQVPFFLADDASLSSEPQTPEASHHMRSFFDPEDSQRDSNQPSSSSLQSTTRNGSYSEDSDTGLSRKGLKQLNEMFRARAIITQDPKLSEGTTSIGKNQHEEEERAQNENQILKARIVNESERAGKVETELKTLKEALSKLAAERDAVLLQYQETLEKLSHLEKDLSLAQMDARGLDQRASEAQTEVKALKEALQKLESERDACLFQYQNSLERVAALENMIFEAQENARRLSEHAVDLETESRNLKQELAKSESEKEAVHLLYKQCLEKTSALESKISLAEEHAKMLNKQSERADSEVKALKEEICNLKEEKEDAALRYQQCLETISKLQGELSEAQEEVRRLNSEILVGSAKLRGAEDQCLLLEKMNESLQTEAEHLTQKIAVKDHELSEKQAELDTLKVRLQDEHSCFVQVEATLRTLQNLHLQSQEEQRALTLELRNGLQMLNDLETRKRDLEVEIKQLKDENRTLSDLNLSSSISEKNLQDEISRLREIKEKLEAEVERQSEKSDVLQQQVGHLKEEIEGLYKRYWALMQQVQSAGLDSECFGSSVKDLQDENSRLMEISVKDKSEKEALVRKLEDMEELLNKSAMLESSLSEANIELQTSKEKMKELQESCRALNKEKFSLVEEKTALLSQLQIITENMQKLLEKNSLLETSLSGANVELEGLRVKSKSLDEFCEFLRKERTDLLMERNNLVSRLENVEQKLAKLETRFTKLEDKYAGLEKERDSTLSQVEELRVCLGVEKQERAYLVLTSEARLSGLEDHIRHLQDENRCRKKEFEEQVEKAVNAQVEIFILQKFIEDMEDKNYNLLLECQRHVEAAKYSESLISELESENMIQQVEAEFLVGKIEKLRAGINQILKALEIKHTSENDPDQNFLPHILENIKHTKNTLLESKNENEQLLIETSILSTMIKQLNIEGEKLECQKKSLDQECLILTQHQEMLEDERNKLLERCRQLNLEVAEREKREEFLKAELGELSLHQIEMQRVHMMDQEHNVKMLEENRSLCKELSDLREEKCTLEEENSAILLEALCLSYQSQIFKGYGIEKAYELEILSQEKDSLCMAYTDLESKIRTLEEKLVKSEMENSSLKDSLEKLEEKQVELNGRNDQLAHQLFSEKQLCEQKESKISETERELKATQVANTELYRTVECLETKNEALQITQVNLEKQIVELSEDNACRGTEIVSLREANGELESELGSLHEEIENYKIRDVILSSELHERSSEFELWEAEAASFYFDLQISSVREALMEDKFHELGSLCEGLEDVSFRRSLEVEVMKEKVSVLESEAEALKSHLAAYVPVIASLKDSVAFLEQNLQVFGSSEEKVTEFTDTPDGRGAPDQSDEKLSALDGLSELRKLQTRIKEVESLMLREIERVSVEECAKANIKVEAAFKEIEGLRSVIASQQVRGVHKEDREFGDQHNGNLKPQKSGSDYSEVRICTDMKDIPLDQASGRSLRGVSRRGSSGTNDQMLELWETAEQDCSHDPMISETQDRTPPLEEDLNAYHESEISEQNDINPAVQSHFERELGVDKSYLEGTKKSILDRLVSDAQMLTSLQISVQELRRNMATNKKHKSVEDVEYATLQGQLQELENSMTQLADTNSGLIKTIEETPSTSSGFATTKLNEAENAQVKKISDQECNEAEKIARLQVEMQKLENVLLNYEDKKKTKSKIDVSKSNATIILRDFFYSHGRSSRKQKKKRQFCGCFRPSVKRN